MTGAIPDPLLRFVPTPHATVLLHRHGELSVESNDAALAAQLLEYLRPAQPEALLQAPGGLLQAIEHLKIVVEYSLSGDGDDLTLVDAGSLRTLLRGTRTMLIHDTESGELLGFLAQDVTCEELVQRLLPAAVGRRLQTDDNGSIAP